MIMASPKDHFDTARKWQEHFDGKLREVGMRAPEPILGQTVNDYRRDVLIKAKKAFIPRTHQLRQFSLDDIKGDALNVIEQKILDAVVVEAQNPANVPRGELREIQKTDPNTGNRMNVFYGQDHFAMLPNFGVNASISFGGGARSGRRMSIFNERTREWYPPRR
jgi:hypothetical protein